MRLPALRRWPWRPVAAAAPPRLPAVQQLGKKLLPPRWPTKGPATLPPCRGICSTWACLEKQGAAGHGEAQGAAAAAREIIDNSRRSLDALRKEHPALKPTLAIVQVGDDAVGKDVIRTIAGKIDLDIVQVCLPPNSTETEITEEIIKVNENPKIHGLLLRLSKQSYISNILNAVKPEKDVAGVTDFNLARVVRGDMNECMVLPLAGAVIKTLEKLGTIRSDEWRISTDQMFCLFASSCPFCFPVSCSSLFISSIICLFYFCVTFLPLRELKMSHNVKRNRIKKLIS